MKITFENSSIAMNILKNKRTVDKGIGMSSNLTVAQRDGYKLSCNKLASLKSYGQNKITKYVSRVLRIIDV